MTCPTCGVVSGDCTALDGHPLPSSHIEREAPSATPIWAELVKGLS